jgi:hypothetical protein
MGEERSIIWVRVPGTLRTSEMRTSFAQKSRSYGLEPSVRKAARRPIQRPDGDEGAAVIVSQGRAEGGLQGLLGAMPGLVEIPVRCGRGGGVRGGVFQGMKAGAIVGRNPIQNGLERGDVGRRERFHVLSIARRRFADG